MKLQDLRKTSMKNFKFQLQNFNRKMNRKTKKPMNKPQKFGKKNAENFKGCK